MQIRKLKTEGRNENYLKSDYEGHIKIQNPRQIHLEIRNPNEKIAKIEGPKNI